MKHAILNRDLGEVRTVIVLGVGRGGTSLVAGCLRALGICMGRNPHPPKHEWSPVLYGNDGKVDLPATRPTLRQWMPSTKNGAGNLRATFSSSSVCFPSCAIPDSFLSRAICWKRHKRAAGANARSRGIESILERLTGAAEEARRRLENRMANSGYEDLNRLFRLLQAAIRVRHTLQGELLSAELDEQRE